MGVVTVSAGCRISPAVKGMFVSIIDFPVTEGAHPIGDFFLRSMAIRAGNPLLSMYRFFEIKQRRKFRNKYSGIYLNAVA